MKLIIRKNIDPYFNIAAEEHFLKTFSDDIIMVWQSSPSVIVGKHQNTMAEINLNYVNKHNIPVIRRISGGGTVYHDEGNINYSIITSSENREQLVNFKSFTKPVIGFLDSLGLKTVFEGKNNLTIDGKKFSGNSAHVFKNRILNHGTLLFNANLDNLEAAICPGNFSISDKAVKSIRANVTNLLDQLREPISIEIFTDKLISYFRNYFNIDSITQLSGNDETSIAELVETKYKLWDWNYGYSPKYNYTYENGGIKINIEINKGIIERIVIDGNISFKDEVCASLINLPYKKEVIINTISKFKVNVNDVDLYMILLGIS
ncbi:MAG: lipoate--protein ligase [Bacteroidetes bacterium]|nr:lipoate--protein ligase [Bacteroidota bacterium]MBL6944354.1 lipoate--protein ligase [Bacteroidales bacterium]